MKQAMSTCMHRTKEIIACLECIANPAVARHAQRFFKTGSGEYGEGDRFRGIRVPELRKLAREHRALSIGEIELLLTSAYHEDRLLGLLILVLHFQRGDSAAQKVVYDCFVRNMDRVNNWDLVDTSAPYMCGPHLFERDRKILYRWAKSPNLWTRRIAVMSTFYFIRQGDFDDTLKLAKLLLPDPEDLMHKAVGWMLREIGSRDRKTEMAFLDQHAATMPRTMLRYAIEKFPERERKKYLAVRPSHH